MTGESYERKKMVQTHRKSGIGRLIAIVCAGAMTIGLAACGGSGASATDADGKPIVRITVRRNTTTQKLADTAWAKQLETRCKCHIQWTEITDNAWGQQKAAKMAAGDFPDISLALYDKTDISKYSSEFEDIEPSLNKLPNVRKFFAAKPIVRKMVEDNGKIQILPSDRGKGYRVSATHMFINKKWLDKLGLKMPATWDELENVLKAFKTKDPNGNGKADEVPMNIHGLNFGIWSPLTLMNSSGVATNFMGSSASGQGYYVQNGKVKSYYTSDALKKSIMYLHKLESEGLIPKDSLTRDSSRYTAQTNSDGKTALTGFVFDWTANNAFGKLSNQYVSVPPLKESASMPDSQVKWDYSQNWTEFAYALTVSRKAPNKQAVWKVVNAMYDPEISVEQYYGDLGKYVNKSGSTYTISDKVYEKYVDTREISAQDRFAGWIPDTITIKNDTNADAVTDANKADEEALKHVDPTRDVIPIYTQPTSAQLDTLSDNNTSISNYANNKIASWFQNGNVDKEWDEYVKKVSEPSLGLKDNIRIWQEAYDKAVK